MRHSPTVGDAIVQNLYTGAPEEIRTPAPQRILDWAAQIRLFGKLKLKSCAPICVSGISYRTVSRCRFTAQMEFGHRVAAQAGHTGSVHNQGSLYPACIFRKSAAEAAVLAQTFGMMDHLRKGRR